MCDRGSALEHLLTTGPLSFRQEGSIGAGSGLTSTDFSDRGTALRIMTATMKDQLRAAVRQLDCDKQSKLEAALESRDVATLDEFVRSSAYLSEETLVRIVRVGLVDPVSTTLVHCVMNAPLTHSMLTVPLAALSSSELIVRISPLPLTM